MEEDEEEEESEQTPLIAHFSLIKTTANSAPHFILSHQFFSRAEGAGGCRFATVQKEREWSVVLIPLHSR